MNFKSISCNMCIFVILLLFLVHAKITSAQALVQPEIGTITAINSGTDRIIEMLQKNDEPEEEKNNSTSKINEQKESEEKDYLHDLDPVIEDESEDIEVFYPSFEPESKKDDQSIHTYKNQDIEVYNGNITLKQDDNEQKHEYKSKKEDKHNDSKKTKIITNIGASFNKVDTGNNGEIKNKISGIDVGLIRELKTTSGKLSIGGIIDYNHNNYDNRADGIDGDGTSNALMVGIVAKQSRDDGRYYEGSVRIGRAKTEFKTNDYQIDGITSPVEYEESAPVYAGHAKLGKIIKLNEKKDIDIYGVYAFSHQDHVNIKTSTKGNYNFGSISSNRLKVGCRLTSKIQNGKIYYGIAYQYEGSAKIKAKQVDNENIFASGKGSSGVIELGYSISADKSKNLNLDFNASGIAGRQKGFMIQAQLVKLF